MRHPKALPFLFLTEMWERFGFYVVQGLLILYMTQAFHFSDDLSYTILGLFSAFAYISPMIGGLIADRLLGFKRSIVWGALFLSAGYAFLAVATVQQFFYALAIIVIGNGLFKPNISSLLGSLYPANNNLRDAGFTLFYVGINIGVLLSGLFSGYIKNQYGWHAGFALASVGLLIGLSIFATGLKFGFISHQNHKSKKSYPRFLNPFALLLYCFLTIPILSVLLKTTFLAKWLLPSVGILLIGFMFYLAFRQTEKKDRANLLYLNILIIASIIFWMMFLQIFFSANLFIERIVNKTIGGFTLPTTVFYTFEPIFVILLGPFFATLWEKLNEKNCNPSPYLKFVVAIALVGFSFLTLTLSTYTTNTVNPFWIVLAYFFLTIGELLLSPIGLSAVTQLSPSHLTGMMMGIWFVALGFGGEFAGLLATFSSIPNTVTALADQIIIYRHAFFYYAIIAFGLSFILFIAQILYIKKLND